MNGLDGVKASLRLVLEVPVPKIVVTWEGEGSIKKMMVNGEPAGRSVEEASDLFAREFCTVLKESSEPTILKFHELENQYADLTTIEGLEESHGLTIGQFLFLTHQQKMGNLGPLPTDGKTMSVARIRKTQAEANTHFDSSVRCWRFYASRVDAPTRSLLAGTMVISL